MKLRTGLALSAAALVFAGAPAYAATAVKVACFQLADDTGDAAQVDGVTPSSPSLDIVSGDIATGTKNLVAVLRFSKMGTDPFTTPGAIYTFSFKAAGVPQTLTLTVYQDGTQAASYNPNSAFGANTTTIPVGAVLDTKTATLTWSVPRRVVPQLKKKGTKFNGLDASARPSFNVKSPGGSGTFTFLNGDTASSPKSYVDGARTCLKGV